MIQCYFFVVAIKLIVIVCSFFLFCWHKHDPNSLNFCFEFFKACLTGSKKKIQANFLMTMMMNVIMAEQSKNTDNDISQRVKKTWHTKIVLRTNFFSKMWNKNNKILISDKPYRTRNFVSSSSLQHHTRHLA